MPNFQSSYRYENGSSVTVNLQTDNYTLSPEDNGRLIVLTNAVAKTITVPALLPVGFNCVIAQGGGGQVTIAVSGTSVNNRQGHTKIAGEFGVVSLLSYAPDTFLLAGDTAA
jgi:hypothetical protein